MAFVLTILQLIFAVPPAFAQKWPTKRDPDALWYLDQVAQWSQQTGKSAWAGLEYLLEHDRFFAAAYTQVQSWKFCGLVSPEDVRAAGFECSASVTKMSDVLDPLSGFRELFNSFRNGQSLPVAQSAMDILENQIFKEAAKFKIARNKCLSERLKSLLKSPESFSDYRLSLQLSWIGLKSTQLLRKECIRRGLDTVYATGGEQVGRIGVVDTEAIQPQSEPEKRLTEICRNPSYRHFMFAAEDLFGLTIPIFSEKSLFEVVEKNRGSILKSATSKPLSDHEIASTNWQETFSQDYQGPPPVSVKADDSGSGAELARDLRKALSDQMRLREIENQELAQGIKSGFSLKTKNDLFAEGIIQDVLKNHRLIQMSEDGSEPVKITNAAGCMLAWHSPGPWSQVFHGFAEGALGGFLLLKTGILAGRTLQASRYARLKALIGAGSLPMVPPGLTGLVRSCFGKPMKLDDKHKALDMNLIILQLESVPPKVYFKPFSSQEWSDSLPPGSTPSCTPEVADSLSHLEISHSTCLIQVLFNFLPMEAAFLQPFVQ